MANIIDYTKYYGDKTFDEVPFNDVDALILAEIAYLNYTDVVNILPNTIENVGRAYFKVMTNERIKNKKNVYKYAHTLFSFIINAPRFKKINMTNYSRIVDSNKQFGAITFKYQNWTYISYEGTNEYMSGWREDFDLSNQFPVPSQTLAIAYLNTEAKYSKKIYVGGHSKGGNLAVVAAMEANNFIKKRIVNIYDFDGPGVLEREYLSEKYQSILPKIKKFTPEVSTFGMILYSTPNYFVVKSNFKGILQHHALSWQCFGSYFIPAKQSKNSIKFSNAVKSFIKDNSEEDIRKFVANIFEILKKSDITTTETVTIKKIIKCINYVRGLEEDSSRTKEKLSQLFNMMLALYMPNSKDEID